MRVYPPHPLKQCRSAPLRLAAGSRTYISSEKAEPGRDGECPVLDVARDMPEGAVVVLAEARRYLTVRHHRIPSRSHVQGAASPLRLRQKVEAPEILALECREVTKLAHVLTNGEGIHALLPSARPSPGS